ncbi:MAG: glycosyltransferase family 4 protein [Longimicrobiaceae bacterium]
MKLLVVNWQDRLNPRAGGAETHLHEIFGRLAGRGHSVTLLASGWKGAPARAEVDGIEVHRTGGRHTFAARAVPYYRRHLSARGFDLLVEDLNKIPLFSPLWARQPVVLVVHHLFGATAFSSAAAPVAAATVLLERPIGRVYRGVPVQAVSESTADDLVERGLGRGDIEVIPNGVDTAFYRPDPTVARAAEPTFIYLGRLQPYKRVDLIIRALERLGKRGRAARLVIAGRGNQATKLRSLTGRLGVAGRVEFAGFVSEDKKRQLFRTAWANLLTSAKEGWGITNLEAAACGTPSIASNSPGLRESVLHERTGLLVPHGDVDALAGAMEKVANPERVERMGREARRFSEQFSWERAADKTEAHLRGVLALPTTPSPPL